MSVWVDIIYDFYFGSVAAYSLVRLTVEFGGSIFAFVEQLIH
jgi:hypothetical protein